MLQVLNKGIKGHLEGVNKLLNPPKELLGAIRFRGLCIEMCFPTFGKSSDSDKVKDILALVSGLFKLCFGDETEPYRAREIFIEILNNAVEHGNQWDCNKNIVLGVWIGKKGVLFGVLDEGDFFKQESTKKAIEKRKPIPSTSKMMIGGKETAGGAGIPLGLYMSDHIQLKDGVVFFTVLLCKKI